VGVWECIGSPLLAAVLRPLPAAQNASSCPFGLLLCQVFVSCRMGLRLEAMKFGVYVSIPVTLVLLTNQTDFMSYFVSKVRQRHIFQTGPLVIPPLGGSPAAASIRSVPADARRGGMPSTPLC
jgi:hypothetical protein